MQYRPIEVALASCAMAYAHLKRDEFIETGDKDGVEMMNFVVDLLQERYNSMYRQWQKMGGKSDIETLLTLEQDDYVDLKLTQEWAT